jgi:hypothetical protein
MIRVNLTLFLANKLQDVVIGSVIAVLLPLVCRDVISIEALFCAMRCDVYFVEEWTGYML